MTLGLLRAWLLRDGLHLDQISTPDLHAMTVLYYERESHEMRQQSLLAASSHISDVPHVADELLRFLFPPSQAELDKQAEIKGQQAAEAMLGGPVG